MSVSGFDLYNKSEYFAELQRRIGSVQAGSRVLLMTMDFEPNRPEIANLIATLTAAAERGVQVELGVDAHSFLADGSRLGPLWYHADFPANLREPYRLKHRLLQQLDSQPTGHVHILNKPARRFSLPVAGRSHIKVAIIDDYVMLGGCNLDNPDHVDLMVGWNDTDTADKLRIQLQPTLGAKSVHQVLAGKDQTLQIKSGDQILVDAGIAHQSLILDRALALIDSAQQWLVITCQFFPNSITAKHLLAAMRRGVDVEIIYTHPRQHSFVGHYIQEVSMLIEHSRMPRSMFTGQLSPSGPYVHAKLIACDQGVMIGSHNYVRAGVQLGTAEIALLSRNIELAKESADKIHAELASHKVAGAS